MNVSKPLPGELRLSSNIMLAVPGQASRNGMQGAKPSASRRHRPGPPWQLPGSSTACNRRQPEERRGKPCDRVDIAGRGAAHSLVGDPERKPERGGIQDAEDKIACPPRDGDHFHGQDWSRPIRRLPKNRPIAPMPVPRDGNILLSSYPARPTRGKQASPRRIGL